MSEEKKDLIVLVADKDQKFAIETILKEKQISIGIRSIDFDAHNHPGKDPGVRTKAHDFLRPFQNQYNYALVIFDYEGCGDETRPKQAVEADVEAQISRTGWGDRAKVIIIEPELEAWVWSESSHVPRVLGWGNNTTPLRQWLAEQGHWQEGNPKPDRPKETFRQVLRKTNKRFSASIFQELATKVSLDKCEDDSFNRLKETLREWFGQDA